MAKFTDAKGGEWVLAVEGAAAKRMRAVAGFDVWGVGETGPAAIGGLLRDGGKFLDTVYAVVKPEADRRGLDQDGFLALLTGDAVGAAAQAFAEAVIDFFPNPLRTDLRQMWAVGRAVEAAEAKTRAEGLAALAADPLALLRPTSTGSPGSSDSTPPG